MVELSKEHPAAPVAEEITQLLLKRNIPEFLRKRHKEDLKDSFKKVMDIMGAISIERGTKSSIVEFSCLPEEFPFSKADLLHLFKDPKKESRFFADLRLSRNKFSLNIVDGRLHLQATVNLRTKTPEVRWYVGPPDDYKQIENTELNKEVVEAPNSEESVEFFGKLLSFVTQHSQTPPPLSEASS